MKLFYSRSIIPHSKIIAPLGYVTANEIYADNAEAVRELFLSFFNPNQQVYKLIQKDGLRGHLNFLLQNGFEIKDWV